MVPPPFVSFAQNAEDVVLWRALREVLNGTYVDVGAAEPVTDSVTKAFADRGWSGVNVEPVPALAEALRSHRPRDMTFAVAAGAHAEAARDFYVVEGSGLSTLVAEEASRRQAEGFVVEPVQVPVRPLDDLLAEAGLDGWPIHFCKIDVEGAEADVLAGFDLERWRPWVLVIEAVRPQTAEASSEAWEPAVEAAGYRLCLFDGLNRFYVSPDHTELAAKLSAPASVVDSAYVSHRQQAREEALRDQIVRLHEQVQAMAGKAEQLEARVGRAEAEATGAAADSLRWRQRYLDGLATSAAWADEADALRTELVATLETLSWRVMAPLRRARAGAGSVKRMVVAVETAAGRSRTTVRAVQWGQRHVPIVRRVRHRVRPELAAPLVAGALPAGDSDEDDAAATTTTLSQDRSTIELPRGPRPLPPAVERALISRLLDIAALIDGSPAMATDLASAFVRAERALAGSSLPAPTAAWLALVAFLGAYPTELQLDRETQRLLLDGPAALLDELHIEASHLAEAGIERVARLRIVSHGVLVDATHTASHDLQTGIQRVVRETVNRWLDEHGPVLYAWDYAIGAPMPLPAAEVEHFRAWRSHQRAFQEVLVRHPVAEATEIVVPWRSTFVLPELISEPIRTNGYRALGKARIGQIALIGFDTIPMTISETVTPGMSANFASYLSVVKYSDRVSAISLSSAREFQGFTAMLYAQGLPGPEVVGHPLPSEAPELPGAVVATAREVLALDHRPLVLVVGSHEPRKNHVTVLVAAERLWRAGRAFHLVFIGGSGWSSRSFDELVEELLAKGRPLQVLRRADEDTLWATYRLARFTVFPSLTEGFGLPIAESLTSGTPVIASNFGSLAEIAEGGGCVTVDPRDPDAVEAAMRNLLDDDALLARLRQEATSRTWKTWDHYAKETWDHLTGGEGR